MMQLTNLWGFLQAPLVAVERILTILNLKPEVEDRHDAKPLDQIGKSVEFKNVTFAYDGSSNVINGISHRAECGTVTALVGPVGAGKTTLLSLIPRFVDTREGHVLIDGIDLRHYTIASLRQHVSLVLQENPLFPTTILDNLLYGANEESEEHSQAFTKKFEDLSPALRQRVESAVRAACLDQFIARLPEGYNTFVGERAAKLSGGEQQRLAVARALMRDAKVLILDEPTSALDPETEIQMLENLRQISSDRIIFIVAHRLGTIRHADQILYIDEGRITERGTHEELLAIPDGHYRRMHEMQYQMEAEASSAV